MKKRNRPGMKAANQHCEKSDFKPVSAETPAIDGSTKPGFHSGELLISRSCRAEADEITVIRFEGCNVRVVSMAGEPCFVAKDVCAALELTNTSMALMSLDEDEKGVSSVYTPGGIQQMRIVAESGFYKLIARSRKASTTGTFAHRFTNWIFREVIPSIRKNGAYGVPFTLLNDFSRRKAAYVKKASQRGHALQACRSEKECLAAEESELWRTHQPQLAGVNDA